LGAESSIYLETDRRAPTRYFYVYPLYTRGYQSADHVSELLAALIEDPPMVIVDASAAAIEVVPPLDRQETLVVDRDRQRVRWVAGDGASLCFYRRELSRTMRLGPSAWPIYRHR